MPTTDLFIKTCKYDSEYHKYCLASIAKFCTGFRDTVVIKGEHPNGYAFQQVVKTNADTYTDADLILITDSDTLMIEPVTPESFMRDGKPIWMMTRWNDAMMANPGTRAWFNCMEKFSGVKPDFEFMRRQPFMFPREVLPELRKFCMAKHGIALGEYILREKAFSEFNVIGHFCYMHCPELFYWMDSDVECPPAKTLQLWSHTPIAENMDKINAILQ